MFIINRDAEESRLEVQAAQGAANVKEDWLMAMEEYHEQFIHPCSEV